MPLGGVLRCLNALINVQAGGQISPEKLQNGCRILVFMKLHHCHCRRRQLISAWPIADQAENWSVLIEWHLGI